VNLTVGVRATYVKDMGTASPPLLPEIARIRPLVAGPLLVSQAFRHRADIDAALEAGAESLHAPRLWPEYHPTYYGAFVRDPDGNNVEAVCHTAPATEPAEEGVAG
jgi:hypothetical protein